MAFYYNDDYDHFSYRNYLGEDLDDKETLAALLAKVVDCQKKSYVETSGGFDSYSWIVAIPAEEFLSLAAACVERAEDGGFYLDFPRLLELVRRTKKAKTYKGYLCRHQDDLPCPENESGSIPTGWIALERFSKVGNGSYSSISIIHNLDGESIVRLARAIERGDIVPINLPEEGGKEPDEIKEVLAKLEDAA